MLKVVYVHVQTKFSEILTWLRRSFPKIPPGDRSDNKSNGVCDRYSKS